MIQLFLLVLLIVIAFLVLPALIKDASAVLAKILRISGIAVIAALLLYLTATGRLNWLFALVGLAIAFIFRLIPALLHYAPQLHRLWTEFTAARQGPSHRQNEAGAQGKMTIEEAYQVLGLKAGASEQEIIAAHRKLIQKIHPDRGGSDYLASKINLAKKILLHK
ncbi:MAG: DnaJ domain-containing protein [Methylococcaceae bacterium]